MALYGVEKTLLIGDITPFITGRGPPCMEYLYLHLSYDKFEPNVGEYSIHRASGSTTKKDDRWLDTFDAG